MDKARPEWDEDLCLLQFAYNTATHSTTKMSPFELIYGRLPTIPADLVFPDVKQELLLQPESYAEQKQKAFKEVYEAVRLNRDLIMKRNKLRCDRKVYACDFRTGDHVWLQKHVTKAGEIKKFRDKWKGIYKILEKRSSASK